MITLTPHYLYFAQWYHTKTDTVQKSLGTKVGITNDPHQRMSNLGGGTIVNLECVSRYLFEFPSKKLAEKMEQMIQQVLKHDGLHDNGEWFNVCADKLFDEYADSIETFKGCFVSIDDVQPSSTQKHTTHSRVTPSVFWQGFLSHLPSSLPMPRPSNLDRPGVGSRTGTANVDWEYRATKSETSVGLYVFKDANPDVVRSLYCPKKLQLLRTQGYRLDTKPVNGESGYIRWILNDTKSGNDANLYQEIITAMSKFCKTYHGRLQINPS